MLGLDFRMGCSDSGLSLFSRKQETVEVELYLELRNILVSVKIVS